MGFPAASGRPARPANYMPAEHTVLVAGARNVDAGKTTVATGLVHALDAVGLKPRAGNDYWYDYDTVAESLASGRLVGKDATRLAAATDRSVEPETINPLHRLWRPLDTGSGAIFGREGSEFLVDRVGNSYVVNGRTDIPREIREGLPIEDAREVETLAEANELMATHHQPALQQVRPIIEGQDRVVIESYSDVARPLQDVEIDVAVVVGAGTLRVFDGDRYCRAASVVSGNADMGRLEERVSDVVDLIQPVTTRSLQPLESAARSDPAAVADAYADIFDQIRAESA